MADKNTLDKADNARLWHLKQALEGQERIEQSERLKLDRQTIAVQKAGTAKLERQADVNECLSGIQRKYNLGSNDQITRDGKIVRAVQS